MFTTWLSEQDDRPDNVGTLSRLLNKDLNNGCMPHVRTADHILRHFLNHHPKVYMQVSQVLVIAYKEFLELEQNYHGI
jgi:hypothetical protein